MPTFWHFPPSLIPSLLSTFIGLLLYTRHIKEPVHSLVGEVGMQVNCGNSAEGRTSSVHCIREGFLEV